MPITAVLCWTRPPPVPPFPSSLGPRPAARPSRRTANHLYLFTVLVLWSTHTQACIEAVRDHGFTSSAYPVIVTLENHTTPEKQVGAWAHAVRSAVPT